MYYKVPESQTSAARLAVGSMIQHLQAQWPGLQAMWMRKVRASDAVDSQCTWMEVYTHPEGVSDACIQAIAHEAASRLNGLIGPRHIEVFEPQAPASAGTA